MKNVFTLILVFGYLNSYAQVFSEKFPDDVFSSTLRGASGTSDVDNDGDIDVLLTGGEPSDFSTNLYINEGDNTFTLSSNQFTALIDGTLVFGDIDGDNDDDLIITGKEDDSVQIAVTEVYINDGAGNFVKKPNISLDEFLFGNLQLADLDGDDDLDLVVNYINGSIELATEIYNNDGSGNFTLNTDGDIEGFFFGSLNVADFNGDTFNDILCIGSTALQPNSSSEATAKLYLNNGQGNFTNLPIPNVQPITGVAEVEDIDGDNDLDIFIIGRAFDGRIMSAMYLNDGDAGFTPDNNVFNPLTYFGASAAFFDADSDGDSDLITTGFTRTFSGETSFYINDGNGSFTLTPVSAFPVLNSGSISVFDSDGDGDTDIILGGVSNFNQADKSWFLINETVVSTEELKYTSDLFSVFPNPASKNLSVVFNGIVNSDRILVLDLMGRVVERINSTGKESLDIDVTRYKKGTYLIKAEVKGQRSFVKVFVVN